MNAHELSQRGFKSYAETWQAESLDYISLCKYTIESLLKDHTSTTGGAGLTLILRIAALLRESVDAYQFIIWVFATPSPATEELTTDRYSMERKRKREPSSGIPALGSFQHWFTNKHPYSKLIAPSLDLPSLADLADELLHLRHSLTCIHHAYETRQSGNTEEEGGINELKALIDLPFFGRAEDLVSRAISVQQMALAEYSGDPVSVLVNAFHGIGLATLQDIRTEDSIQHEHSLLRDLQEHEQEQEGMPNPGIEGLADLE